MELGVTLTVVPSAGEADVICSLLRVEGVEAKFWPAFSEGGGPGYRIFVAEGDLERARELIHTSDEGTES